MAREPSPATALDAHVNEPIGGVVPDEQRAAAIMLDREGRVPEIARLEVNLQLDQPVQARLVAIEDVPLDPDRVRGRQLAEGQRP